jgi:hypothetical protein
MTQATALAFPEQDLVGWERTLYAFLVEKQRRSGSLRTVQGYSSTPSRSFMQLSAALASILACTRQRRQVILNIEQNGEESCSTPPNSQFVLLDIPLRATGDGPRGEAEYCYRIGKFTGRLVPWSPKDDPEVVIRLRIPEEKFRHDAELCAEVFAKGTKVVLWRKNWRVLRRGATLAVEPLEPGGEYRDSDQGRRPRRYRTEG